MGILTSYHEPIGFNYGLLRFCQLAASVGVDVTLIAVTRNPQRNNRLMDEARRLGIPLEHLYERFRYDLSIFVDLIRIVDRLELQIVDLQTYKPLMLGLFARLFRPKLRLVSWVHGFSQENTKVKIFGFLELMLHRFADKVICVAQPFADKCRNWGIPNKKIVTIPNAIGAVGLMSADERAQTRRRYGISESAPVVGAMGRLSPEKGHTFLIKAWPRVIKRFPSARLIFVGDGVCRERLEQEAHQAGLDNVITFAGFQPGGQRFLSLFDIMALPSLHEGLPYVLLESMAAGVPIVASAVGDVPSVLENGFLGRVVNPGDVQGLADAIIGLLSSPQEASGLAMAARNSVAQRFGEHSRAQKIAEVYNEIF